MKPTAKTTESLETALITEYLQKSAGCWHSERRYYTLPDGQTQEMVSLITVQFLAQGSPELVSLAKLHELKNPTALICGSLITWESTNAESGKEQSRGKTLFGILGNIMYRDRGFATLQPVTAEFYLPNPETLCLRTEYNNSVFEEELKQIGHNYRTRQTIITKAGEHKTIGQYLEKRIK
ncbi:MAG: phycobiliprotein lyase [Microcoleus sp.]